MAVLPQRMAARRVHRDYGSFTPAGQRRPPPPKQNSPEGLFCFSDPKVTSDRI